MRKRAKFLLAVWALSSTLALGCGGAGGSIEPAAKPDPLPVNAPGAGRAGPRSSEP